MNIGRINSTPAFKSLEHQEYEPTITYEAMEVKDKFEKTPEDKILDIAKGATVSSVAIPTGLKVGEKVAGNAENLAKEFCQDFAKKTTKEVGDEVAEEVAQKGIKGFLKKFSIKAIDELPQGAKASIKWGVGAAVAAALIYLGTKDADGDGKSDVIEAIKKYLNPASI